MMEMIADMQAAVKITDVAKPRCRLAGAIEVRERQLVKWSPRALLPAQTLSFPQCLARQLDLGPLLP